MPKKLIVTIAALVVVFFVGIAMVKLARHLPFLFQLIFNRDINLKTSNGNINILLLGIGDPSHDGPNLTDTIILASLDQKNNKLTLISIPRDLWFPDLEIDNKKINGVYAVGEAKKRGAGLLLAEKAIQKVTGQEIDYGVRINFSGFVKAIDQVGGLEINVAKSFDDYEYPIDGKEEDPCGHTDEEIKTFTATDSAETDLAQFFPCRYKHLHFDKGQAHMNGEVALELVRSRHAQGSEGTDFARSERQAKVIKAFKDKILSLQTLLNPGKLIGLYNIFKSNIDTDIKEDKFDDFIRLAQKMKQAKIQNAVLDTGDEETKRPGLLLNPVSSENYAFQWVLVPRIGNGNFSEIQNYVDCEIKVGNCQISKEPVK